MNLYAQVATGSHVNEKIIFCLFGHRYTSGDRRGCLVFWAAPELDKPFVAGYSDGRQIARHMAINLPGLARGYMIGGTFNSMTDEWRGAIYGMLGFEGPGAEVVVISNADHFTMFYHPIDIAIDVLLNFMKRVIGD